MTTSPRSVPRDPARAIEFSPFGTLRVAAWPVETLDPFGSRELLAQANAIGQGPGAERATFQRLYAEVLARERAALWERTAGEPHFMKALALANPPLARRAGKRALAAGTDERSDKRTRHLETTLYRLLARAVGRTDPFGAWCGVGFVHLGASTEMQRVVPARFVAPSLSFYAQVLAACRQRVDAARAARYCMNATLGPDAEGTWGFWSPPGTVPAGHVTLASTPQLVAALEQLIQLGTFTIPEAEQALGVAAHSLDRFFFDQLLAQGLMVGGFSLPCFFKDPWDAIEQIEDDLPVPNKPAWTRLRHELKEICGTIEATYAHATWHELAALAERAAGCGARFGADLDLEKAPPFALLMDSSAPFKLTLGRDIVHDLARAVALDEADKSGKVRAFNESLRRVQCELLGRAGVAIAGLRDKSVADLSQAHTWPRVPVDEYFPEWPLRTAFFDLVADGTHPPQITELNLVDDVASALARFFPILARNDSGAAESLTVWLRDAHQAVRVPKLVALGDTSSLVPNAAAQPDLGLPRFSLWGVAPGVRRLAGARIVGIEERGLIAVSLDRDSLGLVSLSAGNVWTNDPAMQLLLMSSFRFPTPNEYPNSVRRVTRRPRVPADTLEEIASRHGIERFVSWAVAVGTNGGRRIVRRRSAPPLWVSIDSPLAVSSLLEGAQASWGDLELGEAGAATLLRDDSGHYVSQVVLPFRALSEDP
jgi:hypothetical protein